MTVYKTYAIAEARVFALVHACGVWPGIIRCPGGWRLTCNPLLSEADRQGYSKC